MKSFVIVWAMFIVFVAGALIFWGVESYHLNRDIDSLIDRAQVAADREDMLEYLNQLQANMKVWGMTYGHTALIFKTPMTDMALHYKAVQRFIERLESIQSISKTEVAYQVALDDIRGTLRELPRPSGGWFWAHYGWWLLLVGVMLFICAAAIHFFSA